MLYQLIVYVPESHVEPVKEGLFAAGAGRIGDYDCCCFQSAGTGQFRPLPGSDAYIGEVGQVETVSEWKLELVLKQEIVREVLSALMKVHPYEEPAYGLIPIMTADDLDNI